MKVLIADASLVFRTQLRKALETIPGIELVGTASNGRLAMEMMTQKRVDLAILDLAMPEMSGLDVLTAIRRIGSPAPKVVICAAAGAHVAAESLQALRLGAVECVIKPQLPEDKPELLQRAIADELIPKITPFLVLAASRALPEATPSKPASQPSSPGVTSMRPRVIVIASSTGGPAALEVLFSHTKGPLSVPILIAQHMPANFTAHLADRLRDITKLTCREAIHDEFLEPNIIYVAPGDYHMRLARHKAQVCIKLDQNEKVHSVRPAADYLFETAAQLYGPGCLGFVLTGMGYDGCAGAQKVKASGGRVVIQDKPTSVVWGMPGAVHGTGAFDAMLSIGDCATLLAKLATAKHDG